MTHRGNRGRPLNPNAWWYRASDEQRLAQIDAAIEIGVTMAFVAVNCGAHRPGSVGDFAVAHGRYFRVLGSANHGQGRRAARTSARAAYFRGEAVDLWRDGAQDRAHRGGADIEAELILE